MFTPRLETLPPTKVAPGQKPLSSGLLFKGTGLCGFSMAGDLRSSNLRRRRRMGSTCPGDRFGTAWGGSQETLFFGIQNETAVGPDAWKHRLVFARAVADDAEKIVLGHVNWSTARLIRGCRDWLLRTFVFHDLRLARGKPICRDLPCASAALINGFACCKMSGETVWDFNLPMSC